MEHTYRSFLVAKGITVRQLAAHLGMSAAYVSGLLHNRFQPSIKVAEEMNKFVGEGFNFPIPAKSRKGRRPKELKCPHCQAVFCLEKSA